MYKSLENLVVPFPRKRDSISYLVFEGCNSYVIEIAGE